MHRVQQTSSVKQLLHKNKTVLTDILGGTTSRVQPLDVLINKPLKDYGRELFKKHIDKNLEVYVEGTLSAAKRRILTTKWVADSSEKIRKQPDMIKHSFSKYGLSNNLDGIGLHNRLQNTLRREGIYSSRG